MKLHETLRQLGWEFFNVYDFNYFEDYHLGRLDRLGGGYAE